MTSSFDARAQTWDDDPRRRKLAESIFAALAQAVPLRAEWTALDYGAGTGLLALALAARVRRVLAVDSSAGMLAVLADKARAGHGPLRTAAGGLGWWRVWRRGCEGRRSRRCERTVAAGALPGPTRLRKR